MISGAGSQPSNFDNGSLFVLKKRGLAWAPLDYLKLEQYENAIYRVLRQKVRREFVSDLAQDVYVKVIGALRRGESIEHFRAYLLKVAGHVAIDHWKRTQTSSVVAGCDDVAKEEKYSERYSIDPPHERLSIIEEVEHVMRKLGSRDQKIVELDCLTDDSCQQIAAHFGLTEGTARKYRDRARAKIQAMKKGK